MLVETREVSPDVMLKCVQELEGHSEVVWCATWAPSGRQLATCGADRTIRLWSAGELRDDADEPWRCRQTLTEGHSRTVRSTRFSACGRFLASASFDATAVVWERNDDGAFEVAATLEGHENEVKCAAWSPSGNFLATCSRDKSVWLWEADEDGDFQVGSILQSHTQDVKFVLWHPDEDLLVSGGYDNAVKFYRYDGEDWVCVQSCDDAHSSTVWSAAFDGTASLLATVGDDRCLKLWKRRATSGDEWHCVCQFDDDCHKGPIYSVDWCARRNVLATACGDNAIRLFGLAEGTPADAPTLELLHEEGDAHDGDVNCVRWHPTEPLLASAADDCLVKLWRFDA